MITNESIIKAVDLTLAYADVDLSIATAYLTALEEAAEVYDIHQAKSIRFDSNFAHTKSVRTARFNEGELLIPNTDKLCTVYEYYVREESQPRFALFSEAFSKSFALRVFTDAKKYKRFASLSKINVLREFSYGGCTFAEYKSEGSEVKRYAMLGVADDIDRTKFINELKDAEPTGAVETTAYFGG